MQNDIDASKELRAVIAEWRGGGGTLAGLLWAWFEVMIGRVKVDEIRYHIAKQVLESWRHGNEREQRETWEHLERALDEDRLSD